MYIIQYYRCFLRSISNNVNITEIIIAMTATTPKIEPIVLEIIIAIVAKIKETMLSLVTILTFFYWSNCNTD